MQFLYIVKPITLSLFLCDTIPAKINNSPRKPLIHERFVVRDGRALEKPHFGPTQSSSRIRQITSYFGRPIPFMFPVSSNEISSRARFVGLQVLCVRRTRCLGWSNSARCMCFLGQVLSISFQERKCCTLMDQLRAASYESCLEST